MSTRATISIFTLSCCAAILSGCGVQTVSVVTKGTATPVGAIRGKVHGGQQPLAYPHIYLYAVGTGGYGTASTSLLLPGLNTTKDSSGQYYVTGDQNGNFLLTGQYVCTSQTQVYAYVSGGNPGLGSASNSAVGLMAALGECPTVGTLALQVPNLIINEASTVVAAYALAGFAVDGRHIASSATPLAATGVANAMATALNMINVATAQVPGTSPTGNAVLPVQNIYTLANILASCVNSAGPSSSSCQTLFTNTGTSTDTAAAAIAIAHAPFSNVSGLFGLASASAPFQPSLGSAPADLTLSLLYQTPLYLQNLTAPDVTVVDVLSIAFDSGGNLWTFGTNDIGNPENTVSTFVKYSPTGSALATTVVPYTTGMYGNGYAPFNQIAVDSSDNLWAGANTGVYKLSSEGALLSPASGYQCPGLSGAVWTAFGSGNTVFVGGQGASTIPILSLTGGCQGSLTASAASFDGELTVTPSGAIAELGSSATGNAIFAFPGSSNYSSFPVTPTSTIGSDNLGNLWTYTVGLASGTGAIIYSDVLLKYSAAGTLLSPSTGYAGGGLLPEPSGTQLEEYSAAPPAIDGAGSIWLASEAAAENITTVLTPIVGLKNDGTPITPAAGLFSPNSNGINWAVAPDGSGNLWVTPRDGSLVEFVGLTTPVATPILYNQLGQRP